MIIDNGQNNVDVNINNGISINKNVPYISASYMTAVMPSVINNNNFTLHQKHQRDDGTQIWHQNGQAADMYQTQVPIDMYGRVHGHQPTNEHNSNGVIFTPAPVEMKEFKNSSTNKNHHFYQFGYSQHPTIYAATSDIYQNQINFSSNTTSNQQNINPYNQVTMVAIPSNNTANFSRPPPTQTTHLNPIQQTAIQVNASQTQQGFIPTPLLHQNFYVAPTPAGLVQRNHVNNNDGNQNNEFNSSIKYNKTNQAVGNGKQNGPLKLLLFDNCVENYTERWVLSTASIPSDMKIVPEQDHQTSTDYSRNVQVVQSNWVPDDKSNRIQPLDEYVVASCAYSQINVDLNNYQNNFVEQQRNRFANINLYSNGKNGHKNNGRNTNRFYQNQAKKNFNNNEMNGSEINDQNYLNVPGTIYYSQDYPQTISINSLPSLPLPNNQVILSESNINLTNYSNKINAKTVECNENNNRLNTDLINGATTSCAVTTWADMVKRSGNCSLGETRFCTTSNLLPNKTNMEIGVENVSLNKQNNENNTEHNNNERLHRYENKNSGSEKNKNNRNLKNNNENKNHNFRNRSSGQNATQNQENNNFGKTRNYNFQKGNNNVYGKKNQNKNATYQTTYPIFQQTIPISIASVGIPSHPPPFSVFNGASMVVPNYNNVSNPQNVNFSNIAPPLSLTSVSNKWNNIGTSGQTFISSNTSKAQSTTYSIGQNVQQSSWPQQQQQQPIAIDAQHQSTIHHPHPASLILSQTSPQLLLTHPAAGHTTSFNVNPVPNYITGPISAIPNAVQPVPLIMCPKTTTTQIQDDKFRNMWLSQDIIPACHIANDKYIYNFVLAHNNTIMAYKDALAKDPNYFHNNGNLLSNAVQMINITNHPNFRVDPRGVAFFLANDQSIQKYTQKNGKNSRQHRHSVNGSVVGQASYSNNRSGSYSGGKFKNKKETNESNITLPNPLDVQIDAKIEKKVSVESVESIVTLPLVENVDNNIIKSSENSTNKLLNNKKNEKPFLINDEKVPVVQASNKNFNLIIPTTECDTLNLVAVAAKN